jgi:hypothetical protein
MISLSWSCDLSIPLSLSLPFLSPFRGTRGLPHLQAIAHARTLLAGLLGVALGTLMHGLHVLVGAAVRLDGLLAVGGQLWLPVALAALLLLEQVLLVALLLVGVVQVVV